MFMQNSSWGQGSSLRVQSFQFEARCTGAAPQPRCQHQQPNESLQLMRTLCQLMQALTAMQDQWMGMTGNCQQPPSQAPAAPALTPAQSSWMTMSPPPSGNSNWGAMSALAAMSTAASPAAAATPAPASGGGSGPSSEVRTAGAFTNALTDDIPTTGKASLDAAMFLSNLNTETRDNNIGFSAIGNDQNAQWFATEAIAAMEKADPDNKDLMKQLTSYANEHIVPIAEHKYDRSFANYGTEKRGNWGLDGGSRWPAVDLKEAVDDVQRSGQKLTVENVGRVWKGKVAAENMIAE